MIRVNGENIEGAEGKNLKEFLQKDNFLVAKFSIFI